MNSFELSTSALGFPLVLGLGETGLAAATWLARHQIPMRVADTRLHYQTHVDALSASYPNCPIEVVLGEKAMAEKVLEQVTTLIISPGLAITDPAVATLLKQAVELGVRIISEIELFALALRDLAASGYAPQLVAVTGTNGKTTVVQMVRALIESAGLSVRVAGNISPAALTALMDAYEQQHLPEVWVIELSSFQLEHTYSLPITAATVLNISQDHLDWHGSMQAYIQAKKSIYAMSQKAVVNQDDPFLSTSSLEIASITKFGMQLAMEEGSIGVTHQAGQPWLSARLAEGKIQYLLPVGAMQVSGTHNIANAMAALALTKALDLDWSACIDGLRSYTGEPHRCQFIRTIHGVSFVNDSKGTNVGATVAALAGKPHPVVLIAGGVAKGQDFSPLQEVLKQVQCRAVVLMGRDASYIAQTIARTVKVIRYADSMQSAVYQAFDLAQQGDEVLLSPACASLDMFANYIERAHAFIDAVNELALDKGEIA